MPEAITIISISCLLGTTKESSAITIPISTLITKILTNHLDNLEQFTSTIKLEGWWCKYNQEMKTSGCSSFISALLSEEPMHCVKLSTILLATLSPNLSTSSLTTEQFLCLFHNLYVPHRINISVNTQSTGSISRPLPWSPLVNRHGWFQGLANLLTLRRFSWGIPLLQLYKCWHVQFCLPSWGHFWMESLELFLRPGFPA